MTIRLNDCDTGKYITRVIGRGGGVNVNACKSKLFWAQVTLTLLFAISEQKKVLICKAHLFQLPL